MARICHFSFSFLKKFLSNMVKGTFWTISPQKIYEITKILGGFGQIFISFLLKS